jgi:hypothetical protein
MMSDENYTIEKNVWSDSDYDQMSFHDVHIHAVCFSTDSTEMSFDVDYIFKWVMPAPPHEYLGFPCYVSVQ